MPHTKSWITEHGENNERPNDWTLTSNSWEPRAGNKDTRYDVSITFVVLPYNKTHGETERDRRESDKLATYSY